MPTLTRVLRRLLPVACATSLAGCGAQPDPAAGTAGMPVTAVAGASSASLVSRAPHTPQSAADSVLARDAGAAFAAWLDASLLPANGSGFGVSQPCDDGGEVFPSPLLADYEVLPVLVRDTTAVVRALVTTVAEQDLDRRAGGTVGQRFLARQRVRRDTLEWDVLPDDAGGWRVCNGIRFGYIGADSLTRWTPEAASLATARALADSVRAARP